MTAAADHGNDSSAALANVVDNSSSSSSSTLPFQRDTPFQIVRVTCDSNESPILRRGVQELFQLYFEELRREGCDLDFQGFQSEWTDLPGKYDFTKRGGLFVAVDVGHDGHDHHKNVPEVSSLPQVVGCVALRPLEESDNSCEVKRMYIRESHRRRGIGNLLAKAVMDLAWEQSYDVIKLDSLERLVAAVNLYERLGFQRIPAYCFCPLEDHVCMSLSKS